MSNLNEKTNVVSDVSVNTNESNDVSEYICIKPSSLNSVFGFTPFKITGVHSIDGKIIELTPKDNIICSLDDTYSFESYSNFNTQIHDLVYNENSLSDVDKFSLMEMILKTFKNHYLI
jgi:hypothetical protein